MADTVPDPIPSWVPSSVKLLAPAFPLGQRLLKDPRMEAVWRVLQRTEPRKSGFDSVDSFQRLRAWGIPEDGLSLQHLACAALFAFAAWELNSPKPVITHEKIEDLTKRCLDAARLCRSPDFNLLPMTPKLSEALSIVGQYFENNAQMWEKRTSPYIIGRSSRTLEDNEARIHSRVLASETHRLFGLFLYGTVATVVTVGLEIEPAVTAKSVQNWCSDLPPQ